MRPLLIILSHLLLFYATSSQADDARPAARPLWLVVSAPSLADGVAPLAEWREKQGLDVVVTTAPLDAQLVARYHPAYLLLVGDVEKGFESARWHVPTRWMDMFRWISDQPKQFASDAAWGDLDNDGHPDLPVGRIPARTSAQVATAVRKILAYEAAAPSEADLQLPVWGGSPGYGPLINSVATTAFLSAVQLYGPAWSRPRLLAADPSHPLCGWPADQARVFTESLRQGGALAFLVGHGDRQSFCARRDAAGWTYSAADAEKLLAKGPSTPPLVFYACDCADYTRATDCIAESFLWMPGGPVATLGASTQSHPLTNAFSFLSSLRALGRGPARLGDLWLSSQREAATWRDPLIEGTLLNAEGSLEGGIDQDKLRRDQLFMYNLLGDPATVLRLPSTLTTTLERSGKDWHWKVAELEGITTVSAGIRWQNVNSTNTISRASDANTAALAAQRRYDEFDKRYVYQPLSVDTSKGWQGTTTNEGPGQLRILATGPNAFRVTVLNLEQLSGKGQ